MPREKEAYRATLEDILAHFDGRRLLTVSDVAEYTGRSRRWCKEAFGIDSRIGISAMKLAQMLS